MIRKIGFISFALLGMYATTACKCAKKHAAASEETVQDIRVTGTISGIENGKDGYTARITDEKDISYDALISIVNLQKSGSTFKRYEVNDVITVSGPYWKDESGITHIMVKELQ